MAVYIILLIILFILLIIIALFSLNAYAVISFCVYADEDMICSKSGAKEQKEQRFASYALSVRILSLEIYRKTNASRPGSKKKKKSDTESGRNVLEYIKSFLKILDIKQLNFRGSVSLGNAAASALAAGTLNALIGAAAAVLSGSAEETGIICIDLRPDYTDDLKLNIFFECILRGNTGNIIITILNILKGKSKHVKPNK